MFFESKMRGIHPVEEDGREVDPSVVYTALDVNWVIHFISSINPLLPDDVFTWHETACV